MTYHLQAGQGFFIAPDFETRYETDGDEPWNYIWVGAAGEEMKHLMHVLGLSQANPIFSCHQETASFTASATCCSIAR